MKLVIKILLLLTIANGSFATNNNFALNTKNTLKSNWGEFLERPSRWSYGGMFGLNFFQDGFIFNIMPMLTYRAHNRVYIGLSAGASYVGQRVPFFNPNSNANEKFLYQSYYFDYSIFARWFLYKLWFVQAEPGYVSFKRLDKYQFNPTANKMDISTTWLNVPYIQAGLGFVRPINDNNFFILRVMYDVLQKEDSPYKGLPVIRGGVNIGL
jgi:hypothetical protein